MFTGELFSLLAVDLFQYLYGLFMAFLYITGSYIIVIELSDVYIMEVFAACKGILSDILCLEAYPELGQVLAAIECPAAYSLDSVGDIDRTE